MCRNNYVLKNFYGIDLLIESTDKFVKTMLCLNKMLALSNCPSICMYVLLLDCKKDTCVSLHFMLLKLEMTRIYCYLLNRIINIQGQDIHVV